ncbi:adenylate kinase-domain-containing protein [Polychytrium aggregatum]|uniref:adenylate kinase-domain-containing protein n=1 Tax=Polychytrium aggregatum TaxID=110093 RepID=UPI0022FE465C|nr:adenylate kinase-domain-containing protein [Polychytrium aggregatum]KAI9193068.1 adenylate kinase-domain-containing protein [Polychytrium aggregatum]
MHDLVTAERMQEFAAYADRHELFELFEHLVSKMLIERPSDIHQFLIENIPKPRIPSIVVVSPPASGESTICSSIAKQYGAVHIQVSALLRVAIEKQTALGVQAKPYMEKGQLVPDVIILGLVTARLQDADVLQRGYVLEGLPRTKEQAFGMQKKGILPEHIILFEIPDDTIVDYLSNLRFDPVTSKMYHLKVDPPPSNPMVEARLVSKAHDSEPIVRARLALYHRHIPGIKACFRGFIRNFKFDQGIFGNERQVLKQVLLYLGMKRESRAPRSHRVILMGLTGCGKTTIAHMLHQKYGFIHVSPKLAILSEISNRGNNAEVLRPFVDRAEEAPEDLIIELIIKRLKSSDCVDKGWILEGFPRTTAQAMELQSRGIMPNRVIWLETPAEVCLSRLTKRRFDPETGRVVHTDHLPSEVTAAELDSWIQKDRDSEGQVRARLEYEASLKSELQSFYGVRSIADAGHPSSQRVGIMHEIDSLDVGEGQGFGGATNPSANTCFELVEGMLMRSIPAQLPS